MELLSEDRLEETLADLTETMMQISKLTGQSVAIHATMCDDGVVVASVWSEQNGNRAYKNANSLKGILA